MANYTGRFRTNYFQVTDEDVFNDWMEQYNCCAEKIICEQRVGFCGYDAHVFTNPIGKLVEDEAVEKLQQLLVDGEACIIEEIGHEKFKYLQAMVTIITKDKYEFLNFDNCFMDFARRVLDNPDYTTEMTY